MALIDDVKVALRQSGSASDTEIEGLIATAELDMQTSGILITETDALIKNAIILFCKANYGYDNPDAARFQSLYETFKNKLSLCAEYAYNAVTFSVTASGAGVDEAQVTFNSETKKTGEAGTAVFYVRDGFNYEYAVSKDGYATQTGNTDVSAAKTVNIALVVS